MELHLKLDSLKSETHLQNVLLFFATKPSRRNQIDHIFWSLCFTFHHNWRQDKQSDDIQHNDTQHEDFNPQNMDHYGRKCDTQHYVVLSVAFFIDVLSVIVGNGIRLCVLAPPQASP